MPPIELKFTAVFVVFSIDFFIVLGLSHLLLAALEALTVLLFTLQVGLPFADVLNEELIFRYGFVVHLLFYYKVLSLKWRCMTS